jgi:hypothetical protein
MIGNSILTIEIIVLGLGLALCAMVFLGWLAERRPVAGLIMSGFILLFFIGLWMRFNGI